MTILAKGKKTELAIFERVAESPGGTSRSSGMEKRRFPVLHGSNTQPLALDPGATHRRGCVEDKIEGMK